MPPQAKIKVNGVDGSNTDVPINVLVQLDNHNNGGETTFLWAILDQPPGAADLLSATNVQAPTFTPRKEGSYAVKLTVNLGIVGQEQSDIQVVAVRQLKNRQRVPAAGETTQIDPATGWAGLASDGTAGVDGWLRMVDQIAADAGGWLVGVAGSNLVRGQVVRVGNVQTIKTGLPGQETLPLFVLATPTIVANLRGLLAVVEHNVDGTNAVGAGGLVRVRVYGRIASIAGAGALLGDPVYVQDGAALVRGAPPAPPLVPRQVGFVCGLPGGAFYDVWFNGTTDLLQSTALVWGAAQTLGVAAASTFMAPGYATGAISTHEIKMIVDQPGLLRRLRVYCRQGPQGDVLLVTVRVNGADTTLFVAVQPVGAGSPQQGSELAAVVPVLSGDLVSMHVVEQPAIAAASLDVIATFDYARASAGS